MQSPLLFDLISEPGAFVTRAPKLQWVLRESENDKDLRELHLEQSSRKGNRKSSWFLEVIVAFLVVHE